MRDLKEIEWKESLLKSVIYRIITVFLGFITTLIITGDLALAIGVATIVELVQFVNYFVFEMLWTNIRTRRLIEEEIERRTIQLRINYDSVLEIAYEMCQINTFVEEVYNSTSNFFESFLKNIHLQGCHEQIQQYYDMFKKNHVNRDFKVPET